MKRSIAVRTFAAAAVLSLGVHLQGWAAPWPPAVTVSGNTLLADKQPWVSGGVNITGLVRAQLSTVGSSLFNRNPAYFGPTELAAARAYGANTVRLQLSEPALDPQSPHYVPTYLGRVVEGVRQAETAGLVVILCMQWEEPTGVAGLPSMPDASTGRAWAWLASIFARDPSVMFELFNEPNLPPVTADEPINSPRRWAAWQAAFQPLIDQFRGASIGNVLIVDGMSWAQTLEGAPALRDPLGQLAYAVHPYPTVMPETPAGWDARFGGFAQTHPVLITEWIMDSGLFCLPDAPAIATGLLNYAFDHRIGFSGWAFDGPGSLLTTYGGPLTNYDNFRCGPGALGGLGQSLQTLFLQRLPQ